MDTGLGRTELGASLANTLIIHKNRARSAKAYLFHATFSSYRSGRRSRALTLGEVGERFHKQVETLNASGFSPISNKILSPYYRITNGGSNDHSACN
jgi:hypothetical protein